MIDIIRPFVSRHECPSCFSRDFIDHYNYHIWDNFSLYYFSLLLVLNGHPLFCFFASCFFGPLNDFIVRYIYVHTHKHYSPYYFNHYRLS